MQKHDLHLELQLCHKIYVATNAITRLYRPLLTSLDLTYPQYLIMIVLWEQLREDKYRKLRISEISDISKIDLSALSLILNKLVSKKYILIMVDQLDQRKKIVSLTPSGISLYNKAQSIPTKMGEHFGHMDQDDFANLNHLMKKLISNI
jgi:DNA-binding MarR family transcriptional regulator